MNNVAMNINIQVSVWTYFLIILSKFLSIELLGRMSTLCLFSFGEIAGLFSKVTVPFYIPTDNVRVPISLFPFLRFIVFLLQPF